MPEMPTILKGTIHGKTIELDREPGYPDGQSVTVEVHPVIVEKPIPAAGGPPGWLARMEVNPAVRIGKFVIKGSKLEVDELVRFLEKGRNEEDLVRAYSALDKADVEAVCA